MPVLTAGDLAAIRERPVGRRWRFYVYQPQTIWTGTVGGSPERGDRALTVTTASGDPTDLLEHCTMQVRDSAGDYKEYPSKVRFKSYSATSVSETLNVADNNIDWAAGDVVTGQLLFEIWPRLLWIDPDDCDASEFCTQYKDRDVAYVSDAHAQGPKANAGPAAITDLTGASVDIVFKDEDSYTLPIGAAPASYQWDAFPIAAGDPGGPTVAAGAENTSTVTYRYTTAGYFMVRLTVTDANGQTGVRYVPVIVDDGTKSINYLTPTDRYWDQYGWVLSERLIGIDAGYSDFYDGAPCFLVADDTQVADTAFVDNRSNLRWSGWLMQDDRSRDAFHKEAVYRAVSSSHILANIPAWPIGLILDASASDWYHLTNLTIDACIDHVLKWHTTALFVCDFHTTGEWTNRRRPEEHFEADDALNQCNNLLKAVFADLRCDRQGILRAMRDEWHLNAVEKGARDHVFTLAMRDYQSLRLGPKRHHAAVREIRASGVDATSNPYLSGSPPTPLDGGRPMESNNLAPSDQDELDQWAGQELANRNWAVPLLVQMSGEYDVFDPAYGEYVDTIHFSSFDADFPEDDCSVKGVRFVTDPLQGVTFCEVELLPDPGTYAATALEIPQVPPPPEPPPPPPPPPPPVPTEWPSEVWVATKEEGIYYTTNFTGPDGAMPDWTELSTGLSSDDIYQFAHDRANGPDQRFFCILDNGSGIPDDEVWRSEGLGNWSVIMNIADATTITGIGTAGTPRLEWVTVDEVTGRVWILFRNRSDSFSRVVLLYSDENGDSLGSGGTWGYVAFADVPAGATFYNSSYTCVRAYNSHIFAWAHKSNIAALGGLGGRGHNMYYSGNNGSTWAYTTLHTITTIYAYCGGNIPPLDPAGSGSGRGYGRYFNDPDYDAININGGVVEIEPLDDINPFPDHWWFSRLLPDTLRVLKIGDASNLSELFATDDDWATNALQYTLDYWNVRSLADRVHAVTDDFMIFGAEDCDSADPDTTAHHILVADFGTDPSDLSGKAGDNVSTPPYTDSIPEIGNGVCYDGLQVVW